MSRRLATLVAALAVFVGIFAPAQQAHAQSASIEVRVIIGKNDGSGVDGALRGLSGQLRSRFGYDSFEQVRVERLSLTEGASRSVSLPNGSSATITFLGMSGSSYRVSASLPGGSGTVTSPAGGVFFVAGPSYQGGTIIIAVRT